MSPIHTLDTFQVHITLPDVFTRRFASLIPQQRERVNQLLQDRVILNYALDIDRSHLWVTCKLKTSRPLWMF